MGLLESLVSIKNIKDNIKNSLSNKGITMTNKTFSDYPSIIDSLDLEKHTLVEKSQTLTTNGTHTLNCDTNKPFSKVTTVVNVNNKTQTKTKSITSNGTVDITPDSGYIGMSKVSVTTNVQPVTETKTQTITTNGTSSISNTSGKYMTKVTTTVNVPDYPNTRNSLYNKYMVSTKTNDTTMNSEVSKLPTFFTPSIKTFVKSGYSGIDCYDMCTEEIILNQPPDWNIRGISDIVELHLNIPEDYPVYGYQSFAGAYTSGCISYTLKNVTCTGNKLKIHNGFKMFMNCKNLTHLPTIDLSGVDGKYTDALHYMFSGCSKLERLNFVGSPSTTMNYMFQNCTSLKEIHGLDISKCSYLNAYSFTGCSNLQIVDFSSSTTYKSGFVVDFSQCTGMTTENLIRNIMSLPDNNTGGTVTIKLTSTQLTNLMNHKSGSTSTNSLWDLYPAYCYIAFVKKLTLSTS